MLTRLFDRAEAISFLSWPDMPANRSDLFELTNNQLSDELKQHRALEAGEVSGVVDKPLVFR